MTVPDADRIRREARPGLEAAVAVEKLSAEFHQIYQDEAKRQGDVRHKDSYAELSENIKEFDRVLARHVLALLERERKRVVNVLVKAAIPLEALRMQPNADYLSPEIKRGIIEGTDALRALAAESASDTEKMPIYPTDTPGGKK